MGHPPVSCAPVSCVKDVREVWCPCLVRDFDGGSSPQRTHSRRSRSTPAAAAEWGSSASLASTTTQNSPRRVAAARADKSKAVRPEEAGPHISGRHPRGRPPVRASMEGTPLETISGAGRILRREAGVIWASLGSVEANSAGRTRCGGRFCGCPSAGSEGRDTSGTASVSKTKGRPRAAEVETTAEDIRFLGRFQGTPGWSRGGSFAFYSPMKILLRGGRFVKREAEKKHYR